MSWFRDAASDRLACYGEVRSRPADGGSAIAIFLSPHYRIVQPWGPDKARQSTVVTERDTIEAAFAEIDRIATQMVTTGSPSDAIELIMVDETGRIVRRPHLA
jgi:hypothetical protein